MGQDPSTIRKDIEHTRERMGDTVEALAYKTDVGARTKDAVTGRVDAVKEKLGVAGDRLGSAADAAPSTDDVAAQGRRAVGLAQENPLGLAIGAVAVGFVAGLLIPNTKVENQQFGPVAGELREHVEDAAQLAVDHAKDAAQDVAVSARDAAQSAVADVADAAKETGQEHAGEAKGDLAEHADAVKQAATHSAAAHPAA
jgi:gas vesicle protein